MIQPENVPAFGFSISWFKEENRQRKLISSPQAKSADTRLSHISILEFSNVSFAQRGAYVCVAIPRISSQDLKTCEYENFVETCKFETTLLLLKFFWIIF